MKKQKQIDVSKNILFNKLLKYINDNKLEKIYTYSFITTLSQNNLWSRQTLYEYNEANQFLQNEVMNNNLSSNDINILLRDENFHEACWLLINQFNIWKKHIYDLFDKIIETNKIFFVYCLYDQIIYLFLYKNKSNIKLSQQQLNDLYIVNNDIQSFWFNFIKLINFLEHNINIILDN